MSSPKSPEENSKREKRNKFYFAGLGMSFGIEFLAAVSVGAFIGSMVDEKMGSKPAFALVGGIVFMGFSLAHIIRLYKRLDSDKDE